ncbi:MAG: carboxymuconolactone decarboxylase family protein [Patescibacteria group bacterium]
MSTLPRVHVVNDEEAKGEVKALFEKMIEQKGGVPKWMGVMANCGDVLMGFFALFKATMDDSPLSAELKWRIAYHISELNKCEFCVSVSEMQLEQFGLSKEEMKLIRQAATGRDALAMEYAEAVNDHAYKIDPALLEKVKLAFSDEELVELTSVVGLFNFINRFNDALGVLPD